MPSRSRGHWVHFNEMVGNAIKSRLVLNNIIRNINNIILNIYQCNHEIRCKWQKLCLVCIHHKSITTSYSYLNTNLKEVQRPCVSFYAILLNIEYPEGYSVFRRVGWKYVLMYFTDRLQRCNYLPGGQINRLSAAVSHEISITVLNDVGSVEMYLKS